MLEDKFLVGGVIAIFMSAGIAYAVISPQYRDSYEEEYSVNEEENDEDNSEMETNEFSGEANDTKEVSGAAVVTDTTTTPANENESISQTQTTSITTKPTPAPTPVTPTETKTPVAEIKPKDVYTLAEVAVHNSQASCWTTIEGKIYDLTPYIGRHPGGEKNIMKVCGKDGTAIFENQHGGESKPETRLQSLYVGTLI